MDVEAHGPCESADALGGSSTNTYKKNERVNETTTTSTSLCSDAAINGIGHLGRWCSTVLVFSKSTSTWREPEIVLKLDRTLNCALKHVVDYIGIWLSRSASTSSQVCNLPSLPSDSLQSDLVGALVQATCLTYDRPFH